MDTKIIHINFAHFSFERCCGYNLPLPEMIAQFFAYMRGVGPDAFVIKRYTFNEGQADHTSEEIMRGCVPTSACDLKVIRQAQLSLSSNLDLRAEEARRTITRSISNIYELRHDYANLVFVNCDGGIIGCGWYDSARTIRKGMKLAEFMLYALGSLNKWDKTLLTAVYNYLPYEGTFSLAESEKASDIFTTTLAQRAVRENGRPHVVMN